MRKEEFKNYNIICTNEGEVKECFKLLEKMGQEVDDFTFGSEIIVLYQKNFNKFKCFNSTDNNLKNISFYNFKKEVNKILKEEKNKVEDIEYDEETGIVFAINNYNCNKSIFNIMGDELELIIPKFLLLDSTKEGFRKTKAISCMFISKEKAEKYRNKLEVEFKLKQIAHRLNNGKTIDWDNDKQDKYMIYYDLTQKDFYLCLQNRVKYQGVICCLSQNFLDEAIKEIGEENLIKYFKEC